MDGLVDEDLVDLVDGRLPLRLFRGILPLLIGVGLDVDGSGPRGVVDQRVRCCQIASVDGRDDRGLLVWRDLVQGEDVIQDRLTSGA